MKNNKRKKKVSVCECGKKKDYRAKQCARCSRKSVPVEGFLYDDCLIKDVIKNSVSFLEATKKLPYNRTSIVKYVKSKKIDISHFKGATGRLEKPDSIFNISKKRRSGFTIKKYALFYKVLEDKCHSCELPPIWKDSPLCLQLHHIDGNPLNNKIPNITLLCPNCHSQTDTYTGKNFKKKKEKFV